MVNKLYRRIVVSYYADKNISVFTEALTNSVCSFYNLLHKSSWKKYHALYQQLLPCRCYSYN